MANELKQVELMQADVTANGITFSNADLQGIADAHNALGLDGKCHSSSATTTSSR